MTEIDTFGISGVSSYLEAVLQCPVQLCLAPLTVTGLTSVEVDCSTDDDPNASANNVNLSAMVSVDSING